MKRIFIGILTAALALGLISCAHSSEPSHSAEALNTFNAFNTGSAAVGTETVPGASASADASFLAGTLPPQNTAGGAPTAETAENTQASATSSAGVLTPVVTAAPRPTATPAPVRTPAATPTPTPTTPPVYTPEPTTTPLNEPVPTAVVGEPKEHYDDIKGINGKNNSLNFEPNIVHADNYLYFTGGVFGNEQMPYGTYRMDVRTEKLEYFSQERMADMFIAGEWLYYKVYDSETQEYCSYRMHSDGTSQTKLSYLMPDVFCYLDGYLYYIEEGRLYRRLISGEDQPVLEREPDQGNKFSDICTDGENLYIVSDSADGARIYKQSGSESEILWTGDSFSDISYDSGYLWGYIDIYSGYGIGRISVKTGKEEFRATGEIEEYYNILNGRLYLSSYDYFLSMDSDFQNEMDLSEMTYMVDWICQGRFRVIGDYICFDGIIGMKQYHLTVLHTTDGSGRFMILDADLPEQEEMLSWQKLD